VTSTSFTKDAICEAAERKAGCSDYGSESYAPGLEALLYSIEHEAALNERGRAEMFGRIAAALANRLTVVAWEKANPELADAPIAAPLVILGLPRTGSSILHETLAAAPGMRTPLIWEVRDFALAHAVTDARTDDRIQAIEADIARKNEAAPGYAAIHYEDAHIPMECLALTILDLVSTQFPTIAWTPTYRRFLLSHDGRETYRWHRRALRYLQASRPEAQWVLKAPMHSVFIAALIEIYPDAKVLQTHRNPLKVIGSQCSLNATLRRAWSDRTDTAGQAAADAAYTAAAIQRAVDYRRANPDIDAIIYDVAFKDFIADQEGTLAHIYEHVGLPFTDEARDAMIGYLNGRPREKHGRHNYALEDFGLTDAGLAPLFADYVQRYREFL
jgi:hypothetical protein